MGTMPKKLLWLDLEMTGLDQSKDRIVEVGAIVTDFEFNELDSYEAVIRHTQKTLDRTKKQDWYNWASGQRKVVGTLYDLFEENGLIEQSLKSSKTEADVEQDLIEFIDKNFKQAPSLAGNSIHNDFAFIARRWPKLHGKLHYRMLDVTSFKLWWQGAYGIRFHSQDNHRALDGIRGSITELKFYVDKIQL